MRLNANKKERLLTKEAKKKIFSSAINRQPSTTGYYGSTPILFPVFRTTLTSHPYSLRSSETSDMIEMTLAI